MKDIQFTAIVMMTLMSLALIVLLPQKVGRDHVANRSRWFMAFGLALLGVQFLVQYIFGFRTMGVTRAVIANLAFFIPCTSLISLSVLNLQCQGRLSRTDKWAAVPTWLLAMAIICAAAMTDHHPELYDSPRMLWAESAASAVYGMMQVYYSIRHFMELRRMEQVLDDYYDRERRGLLRWMKWSTIELSVLALFVPALIFSSGWPLRVYGVFFFLAISAVWFCFTRYLMSGESLRMQEAEEAEVREEGEKARSKDDNVPMTDDPASEDIGSEPTFTAGELAHVEQVVEQWMNKGGHLRKGLKSPDAAHEMQLSRPLLKAWYTASGYESFKQWINALRMEEAKHMLTTHPDWSNESVADHCGLSRTHFHKIFKDATGLSPADFVKAMKA